MTYKVGEVLFDKYRIEELLGAGSFGEVYRVTYLPLGVLRAVKVLKSEGCTPEDFAKMQNRFRNEFMLQASLNSPSPDPHLLQVFEALLNEDLTGVAMEYAPGGNLAKEISASKEKGSPLPLERVLQVGVDVAKGLGSLHRRDVVHRDLKPANILFDGYGHARVADLGLVQTPDDISYRGQLSTPPPHPGAPAYMSPEQENTRGILKAPSDIYALGVVLYEMLTRRSYKYLKAGTPVREHRAEVPEWLDELVMGMLAEDANRRPFDGDKAAELLLQAQKRLTREAEEPAPLEPVQPNNQQAWRGMKDEVTKKIQAVSRWAVKMTLHLKTAAQRLWHNLSSRPWHSEMMFGLASVILLAVAALVYRALANSNRMLLQYTASTGGNINIFTRYANESIEPVLNVSHSLRNYDPAPGPLGRLYFVSNRDGSEEIYFITDGKVHPMTNAPGQKDSWSPAPGSDGYLYFTSDMRDGKAEIYRVTSGSEPERVTHTPGQAASWDPAQASNGRIYFVSNRLDGKAEIYYLENSQIHRQTFTAGKYESWAPSVRADGQVYFTSDRDGGRVQVYRTRPDGSVEQVTHTGQNWSPVIAWDGSVYYTSDRTGSSEVFALRGAGDRLTISVPPYNSWTGSISGRYPRP